jgi:hypothetical protein
VAGAANERAGIRRELESAAKHYAQFTQRVENAAYMAGEPLRAELVGEATRSFSRILDHLNFSPWAKAYQTKRRK